MIHYKITLQIDDFQYTYFIEPTNIINSLDKAELYVYGQLILASNKILSISTILKEQVEL